MSHLRILYGTIARFHSNANAVVHVDNLPGAGDQRRTEHCVRSGPVVEAVNSSRYSGVVLKAAVWRYKDKISLIKMSLWESVFIQVLEKF